MAERAGHEKIGACRLGRGEQQGGGLAIGVEHLEFARHPPDGEEGLEPRGIALSR